MLNIVYTINKLLSLTILGIAVFIVGAPFAPDILFALRSGLGGTYSTTYESQKISSISVSAASSDVLGESTQEKELEDQIIKTNGSFGNLLIPRLGMDGVINEGVDKSALNLGLWRRPHTSTPDKGGNTVIVAHRFMYTSGSNTFYHLDKVQMGDIISVNWKGITYAYKVFSITEVEPDAVEIENNTIESIITLYTCTPLFTADRRLVVKAKLI